MSRFFIIAFVLVLSSTNTVADTFERLDGRVFEGTLPAEREVQFGGVETLHTRMQIAFYEKLLHSGGAILTTENLKLKRHGSFFAWVSTREGKLVLTSQNGAHAYVFSRQHDSAGKLRGLVYDRFDRICKRYVRVWFEGCRDVHFNLEKRGIPKEQRTLVLNAAPQDYMPPDALRGLRFSGTSVRPDYKKKRLAQLSNEITISFSASGTASFIATLPYNRGTQEWETEPVISSGKVLVFYRNSTKLRRVDVLTLTRNRLFGHYIIVKKIEGKDVVINSGQLDLVSETPMSLKANLK